VKEYLSENRRKGRHLASGKYWGKKFDPRRCPELGEKRDQVTRGENKEFRRRSKISAGAIAGSSLKEKTEERILKGEGGTRTDSWVSWWERGNWGDFRTGPGNR